MKQYFWRNRFNGVESDGPFDTPELARAEAVNLYDEMRGGFALGIVIVDEENMIVAEGHIHDSRWHDGPRRTVP